MSYPEHDKLKKVAARSQAIGEFLDWLSDVKSISLATQHEHTSFCRDESGYNGCGYRSGEYMPVHLTTRALLAEFLEIDEEKLELEKQSMLAELRKDQE